MEPISTIFEANVNKMLDRQIKLFIRSPCLLKPDVLAVIVNQISPKIVSCTIQRVRAPTKFPR